MPQKPSKKTKKAENSTEDGATEDAMATQGDNSASKECKGSSEANATTENTDNAILQAINGLKTEFSSKLDGVLSAVNSVKSELTRC
ncbi:hypothetical protein CesoFtcFv8_001813 [Champsocephalus esox]|uniref:Uncharacterized protein n=1 Tax=Champsocephalus esox TaxID=159716 RepID=A0AAN8D1J1_9TELE|nr:hypothetical protein CesoFtcFv8_001813 [Champsocephalus esox]